MQNIYQFTLIMIIDNFITITSELENLSSSRSFVCFPEQCINYLKCDNFNTITVIHLNIRSINHNFDSFSVLLATMNITADILVLSECWLSKAPFLPQIPGYNSHNTLKNANQNSGVVLFVKNNINCKVYEPNCIKEADCLVCEIGKSFALVAVYRSPSYQNIDTFLNSLNYLFMSLPNFQVLSMVGDLNIDIKLDNEDSYANEYLDLNATHGLLPTHTFVTRGDKCYDHVMLKSKLLSTTLVLDTHITDHKPTFLIANLKKKPEGSLNTKTKIDYENIHRTIINTDFSHIYSTQDVNLAVNNLISTTSDIIKNNTCTVKVPRSKINIKPWITPGLLRCIRNRDKMHRKLQRDPDNLILKTTYTRYRNFINKLLQNIKRTYHKQLLNNAKNNSKSTWSVIKTIANVKPSISDAKSLLNLHPNQKTSVNLVNEFFVDVGKSLACAIQNRQPPNSPTVKSHPEPSSMVFYDVDEHEIDAIITSLRSDCAIGWDGISARILQTSKLVFVPLLTHICQLAISTGKFPDAFKKALVHPIYKSGNKDDVSNYRPISVLTALSKILERILNNRLINYLESKNILAKNQFGFRRGISTEDAVNSLLETIVEALDGKHRCIGMFLDLSKAFDTVSIPLLVTKLESIGIRGLPLSIFEDYLQNRTQCVKIDGVVSDERKLVFGVPQGSILGPTLFLIYINDLCKLHIPHCQIFVYADDTAMIVKAPNWPTAFERAEKSLSQIMSWLDSNLLTLNSTKTNYITFAINSSTLPPENEYSIKAHTCGDNFSNCTCLPLTRSCTVRYLGVQIDNFLTWKQHIKALIPKIRKLIYIFKNLNKCADLDTLKLVYNALCKSLLAYCITAWGGAAKTTIMPLERAQRAVLKVMTRKPYRYSSTKLYADTSVLTVRQIYIMMTLQRKHTQMPYDPTIYERRRRSDLVCATPIHRTVFASRHFKVFGCCIYNKVNKILNIYPNSKRIIKEKIKQWLLTLDYTKTEDLI